MVKYISNWGLLWLIQEAAHTLLLISSQYRRKCIDHDLNEATFNTLWKSLEC